MITKEIFEQWTTLEGFRLGNYLSFICELNCKAGVIGLILCWHAMMLHWKSKIIPAIVKRRMIHFFFWRNFFKFSFSKLSQMMQSSFFFRRCHFILQNSLYHDNLEPPRLIFSKTEICMAMHELKIHSEGLDRETRKKAFCLHILTMLFAARDEIWRLRLRFGGIFLVVIIDHSNR